MTNHKQSHKISFRSIFSLFFTTPAMLWLIFFVSLVYFLYNKLCKPLDYWKQRRIPHVKPKPFFGNMFDYAIRRKTFVDAIDELYRSHPESGYVGVQQFQTPVIIIKDPELIKQVCIKEFESFPEHQLLIPEGADELWNYNLFALRADKWKTMRPTLSPAFTSSKMKTMFSLMEGCARQFVDYFLQHDLNQVELKDVFTRYTNDVIASTAFGIECDSLKQKDNQFYKMGRKLTDASAFAVVKFLLFGIIPSVLKFLNIRLLNNEAAIYFTNVIKQTFKQRTESGVVRPDVIHLLLEAQKRRNLQEERNANETGFASVQESEYGNALKNFKPLTQAEMESQAFVFFIAGFDTVSSAISFTVYELATNPDVQQKLREEIDQVWLENDEKLTYDALTKMKYMDMVVSESLRKNPPAIGTDRVCLKSVTIETSDPKHPLHIKAGEVCMIPIYSLHRDEKYYPNPNQFDPERFSDENKHKLNPGAYAPFGIGPRNCIGSRFALLELKTILFHLIKNFEVVPNKKSQIPFVPIKTAFLVIPEKGLHFDFKKRQN